MEVLVFTFLLFRLYWLASPVEKKTADEDESYRD
jgi:hypothetical protein